MIQEYWGTRWEDVAPAEDYNDAKQLLKNYRENSQVPVRMIKRMVNNPEYDNSKFESSRQNAYGKYTSDPNFGGFAVAVSSDSLVSKRSYYLIYDTQSEANAVYQDLSDSYNTYKKMEDEYWAYYDEDTKQSEADEYESYLDEWRDISSDAIATAKYIENYQGRFTKYGKVTLEYAKNNELKNKFIVVVNKDDFCIIDSTAAYTIK